jgi:hypothetical protein
VTSADALLPLDEVTRRLHITGQRHVGVQPIPIDRIVGSVDRTVDFDRLFRPRRRDSRERMRRAQRALARDEMPPIQAYEVGGVYFVLDGHHRVAASREAGAEFIDAQVTSISVAHRLHPDVDVRELIHTEQHRSFMERSGLALGRPDAQIEFSRPTWYSELLELVRAHAYRLSDARGELVPMPEAAADWYDTEYLAALEAVRQAELPEAYRHKTPGDIFLWVHAMRRQLRTTDPAATWADAAVAARREGVPRAAQEALKRERRRPLPTEPA